MRLKPTGHHVLIAMDKAEDVTKGGIIIPKDHTDREQNAMVFGTLVDVGETAWFDKGQQWAAIGDRCLIAKYSGFVVNGDDYGHPGLTLRIIADEDVKAIETGE
jgi:co-chaperonin GroES (HSP10)